MTSLHFTSISRTNLPPTLEILGFMQDLTNFHILMLARIQHRILIKHAILSQLVHDSLWESVSWKWSLSLGPLNSPSSTAICRTLIQNLFCLNPKLRMPRVTEKDYLSDEFCFYLRLLKISWISNCCYLLSLALYLFAVDAWKRGGTPGLILVPWYCSFRYF